jgi:hypothetical protein
MTVEMYLGETVRDEYLRNQTACNNCIRHSSCSILRYVKEIESSDGIKTIITDCKSKVVDDSKQRRFFDESHKGLDIRYCNASMQI